MEDVMTRREVGKAIGLAAFSAAGLSELLQAQRPAAGKKDGDSIGVKRLFEQAVPDIGGKEVRLVLLTVEPGAPRNRIGTRGRCSPMCWKARFKTRWIRSRSGPTTPGTFFTSPPCMCIAR